MFVAWRVSSQNPLPPELQKQVRFPVLVPDSGIAVSEGSYKYDPAQGVLSFTGAFADGQQVTFAEQQAPSSFTDIPNFYEQFLQKMYDYQSFDCLAGTMHLTHPKGAGQAAVMSAKGTLLFARVSRDESSETWRSVCNALQTYAP